MGKPPKGEKTAPIRIIEHLNGLSAEEKYKLHGTGGTVAVELFQGQVEIDLTAEQCQFDLPDLAPEVDEVNDSIDQNNYFDEEAAENRNYEIKL